MKPMKFSDVIRLLEDNGFQLIRSNGHMVYANGIVRIALAHSRVVSPGVMRSVVKAIKQVGPTAPMSLAS
jgi:predicted RNA binding protein YcfA (HicA-like mRNA interferase family)